MIDEKSGPTRRDMVIGVASMLAAGMITREEADAAGVFLLAGPPGGGSSGFNNGKSAVNPNFIQGAPGELYSTLNVFKGSSGWIRSDGVQGGPDPRWFDSNGYPAHAVALGYNGGVQGGTCWMMADKYAQASGLSANWRISWSGRAKVWMVGWAGHNSVASALDATDYVSGPLPHPSPAAGDSMGFGVVSAGDGSGGNAAASNLCFCNMSHAALVDAGEIWNPQFIKVIGKASQGGIGAGIIRFLNATAISPITLTQWSRRKPLGYVYWKGWQFDGSLVPGSACSDDGAGNYSIAAPAVWGHSTPQDRDMITFQWSSTRATSPTTNPCTLNVGGGGAKKVMSYNNYSGFIYAAQGPQINYWTTMFYDAVLDSGNGAWIILMDSNAAGFGAFINNSYPYEACANLCLKTGTHPWFSHHIFTADDPTMEFSNGLFSYFRDNMPSWMIPHLETVNEVWNGGDGGYGAAKAAALWPGGSTGDWHGMVASLIGQAGSAVYGGNRTRYRAIVGYKASDMNPVGATNSQQNLESALYIGNSKQAWAPATCIKNNASFASKNWLHLMCIAAYVNPYPAIADATTLANWEAAMRAGDLTTANAQLDAYIATFSAASVGGANTLPYFNAVGGALPNNGNGAFLNATWYAQQHLATSGPNSGNPVGIIMYEGAMQNPFGQFNSSDIYRNTFLKLAMFRPAAGTLVGNMHSSFLSQTGGFPAQYYIGDRSDSGFAVVLGGVDNNGGGLAGNTLTVTSVLVPGPQGIVIGDQQHGSYCWGIDSLSVTLPSMPISAGVTGTGGTGTYTLTGTAILIQPGTLIIIGLGGTAAGGDNQNWSCMYDIYQPVDTAHSPIAAAIAAFNGN